MKITVSRSNTKIGKIANFSVSCLTTCPGQTTWCAKKCYAKRLEVQYPNVRSSYADNFKLSKLSNFSRMVTLELKKLPESYTKVRIHVGGDFYSVLYINKWISIVKSNPNLSFYAYTKSWRIPHMIPHLQKLAALSNMVLFASTDLETFNLGETVPLGFREAYAGDIKPAGRRLTHCLVQTKTKDTCDACNLCMNKKINTNIYFSTH